jgi:hypothetical protein
MQEHGEVLSDAPIPESLELCGRCTDDHPVAFFDG